MFKVAMAVRDGLETSWGLHAINAIHPSADLTGGTRAGDDDGDVWTVTYRHDGGYVRMTGGL